MPLPIAHHIYNAYGRFYDLFQFMFRSRLQSALATLPFRPGDRVLDIGIGTGLSLDCYPDDVHLTGVDLCPGMLQQAQRKLDYGMARANAPHNSTQLIQADALHLPFADHSFDCVFLSHVIATVSDPHRCLAEAFRVARPNAIILLVNHFRSPHPVLAALAASIDPLCRKLGWRSDLTLAELLRPFNVKNAHRLDYTTGSIFRIVQLQKRSDHIQLLPVFGSPFCDPMFNLA